MSHFCASPRVAPGADSHAPPDPPDAACLGSLVLNGPWLMMAEDCWDHGSQASSLLRGDGMPASSEAKPRGFVLANFRDWPLCIWPAADMAVHRSVSRRKDQKLESGTRPHLRQQSRALLRPLGVSCVRGNGGLFESPAVQAVMRRRRPTADSVLFWSVWLSSIVACTVHYVHSCRLYTVYPCPWGFSLLSFRGLAWQVQKHTPRSEYHHWTLHNIKLAKVAGK